MLNIKKKNGMVWHPHTFDMIYKMGKLFIVVVIIVVVLVVGGGSAMKSS